MHHGLKYLSEKRHDRWETLIAEACATPAVEFKNNGWVIHALQAALSAVVRTPVPPGHSACEHAVKAIETAVGCGNDTDTVAAIAGALLGARWGETALPLRWRSVLHGKQVYRSPELTVRELEAMARLSASSGRPDSQGWPGAERLVPYYMDHFWANSTPQYVEIAGVYFGNIAVLQPACKQGQTP